jgi:hypothetical protein
MNLTENNPFFCSPHTKRSLWFVNYTSATMATTSCHTCKLISTRDLLKATFNGVSNCQDCPIETSIAISD